LTKKAPCRLCEGNGNSEGQKRDAKKRGEKRFKRGDNDTKRAEGKQYPQSVGKGKAWIKNYIVGVREKKPQQEKRREGVKTTKTKGKRIRPRKGTPPRNKKDRKCPKKGGVIYWGSYN